MYLPYVYKLSVTCKESLHIEVKEFGCFEFRYVKALTFIVYGDLEILLCVMLHFVSDLYQGYNSA
jgi:hypothetical protein